LPINQSGWRTASLSPPKYETNRRNLLDPLSAKTPFTTETVPGGLNACNAGETAETLGVGSPLANAAALSAGAR